MKIIPVQPRRQWGKQLCGAAIYWMVVRHFNGIDCPREKLSAHLGGKSGGVTLQRLASEFRECGLKAKYLSCGVDAIDRAIRDKQLVVVEDASHGQHTHFVMVTGYARQSYVVIDPARGMPTLRSKQAVVSSAARILSVGRTSLERYHELVATSRAAAAVL